MVSFSGKTHIQGNIFRYTSKISFEAQALIVCSKDGLSYHLYNLGDKSCNVHLVTLQDNLI